MSPDQQRAVNHVKAVGGDFVTVDGIPESHENPFPFQDLFGTRHPSTKTKYNDNLLLVVDKSVEIYINPNPSLLYTDNLRSNSDNNNNEPSDS